MGGGAVCRSRWVSCSCVWKGIKKRTGGKGVASERLLKAPGAILRVSPSAKMGVSCRR